MTSREYAPLKMNAADRETLAQDYVDIVSEVFIVKDRDRLFNNVARARHDVLKLRVFRNAAGKVVGFFKVTVDYGERNGRKFAAFNSHAGFLREYRGGSSTVALGLKTLLAETLKHPGWDIFYMGMLLHPSSYSLFTRYAIEYWPRWDRPTPAEQVAFMSELADVHAKPDAIYDAEHPLVRSYYIGTRTLEQEEAYWRSSEKETVKYFLRVNPRYPQGAGVFTWIKLDGRLFRTTLSAILQASLRSSLLSAKAALMKSRIGKTFLPKPDIASLLRAVPLFAALPDSAIQTLARSADTVLVKGGTSIIRQGDAGDSLYAIAQGSAYVLLKDGDKEQIVEQLRRGEVFGEMALLTGEPRSASVRSATAMVAVRVNRAAFDAFLRANPSIAEDLWALVGKRRFDACVRGQERFRDLGREARTAWYDGGARRTMNAGETVSVRAEQCVFLVAGGVEVNTGEAWFVVNPPALIEFGGTFEVRASVESRICLLDKPASTAAVA